MTQRIRKPAFIDPAGDPRHGTLPVQPPFMFREVTTRVFPLKANIARLTHFCDQYLNMDIPPSIVHYRPSLPYVYMMVLNYGSMSAASVQAQNVGWVAQHEVTFTVPLQRWREENGKLVFKDWASVSPFIFVDAQMSLTTGREVYGWPKVAGVFDAYTPLWMAHPRAASRQFSMSTHVFPKVYAGEAETLRTLLQVDSDPSASYDDIPPDPGNPWFPLSAVPNALRTSLSLSGTALDMLLALRVRGFRTNRSVDSLLAMGGNAGFNLANLVQGLIPGLGRGDVDAATSAQDAPRLSIDNVTLKQFRDAAEPNDACYKALVSSRMGFDRLNKSGLLGGTNLLRGDPSGGYSVRIHRYTSQPIIESLGLEVASEQQQADGGSVAILKPAFPFWTDVDLFYGKGQVICSRTHVPGDDASDKWIDEQADAATRKAEAPAKAPPQGGPHEPPMAPPQATPQARQPPEARSHNAYNTALGAATQPVAGPFHFPDVTLQVYPLLAERAQLDAFLAQYLNTPLSSTDLRFETFGSYVYLMVQVCDDEIGTMWSGSNNIGWWASREVTFCVPVKWYRGDQLISVGMVSPFVYSNNGRAVITDREVNGRASVAATIDSPRDVWLTASGPTCERQFLHMETEIFPALNLGQKAESRTLLDIDERDVLAYNDDVGWRMVADTWGRTMVDDLKRKADIRSTNEEQVLDAKALALEILAHGAPVNWINLKQYRDAADIDRACYQAVVRTERSITRIYDIREIEQGVHVRLHRVAGHPIVKALGLKVKSQDSINGNVVDNLQPLRPFWMRVSLKETLATVVGWRATGEEWTISDPWFNNPGGQSPDATTQRAPSDQEATPATAAGDARHPHSKPYFGAPGATRVGKRLAMHNDWWQRLKDHSEEWLRKSLRHEMELIKPQALDMTSEAWEALQKGLSASDSAELNIQLDRMAKRDSLDEFCAATSIESLMLIARVMPQSEGLTPELQRLTREDAKDAITALDDVQVVIESILSDEWENWGNPRRYQEIEPKPEQCIPCGSVYGGSDALKGCKDAFATSSGLERFENESWWRLKQTTKKGPA